MRAGAAALLLAAALSAAACGAADRPAGEGMQAVSLLGDTLYPPALDSATAARFDATLAAARAAHERTPDDLDSIIWLGRRTAYRKHYREAIGIYTAGLEIHPDHPRLLRHRGHRYISTRELDAAAADLSRAAERIGGSADRIEEDGLPNARGIPTSTLHTNIWYHLGLAHYLRGEFPAATAAYQRGLRASTNPDMLTAMAYWLYLSHRRLGETREAERVLRQVRPDFDIIENDAYHRLMMLYQGRLPADSLLPTGDTLSLNDATTAYGVGAWHLLEGRDAVARDIFRRIVAAPDRWDAFGYIAAEAELAREVGRSVGR